MTKKIFILTGEPSGDKLASKAINELKKINPNVDYLSVGGENLNSINIKSIYELSDFIALIEKLGYSAIDHKLEYYNLIIMPILILSLVVLAHSLTFKLNHNDKILNLMILSIFCVFIFYFTSNLFNALSLSSQINPLIGISLVPLILFIISIIFFKIPNKLF